MNPQGLNPSILFLEFGGLRTALPKRKRKILSPIHLRDVSGMNLKW
jgi:hypothetical protein